MPVLVTRGGGGGGEGGCDGQSQERDGRKEGAEQPRLRLCLSLPAVSNATRSSPPRRAYPPPSTLLTPPPHLFLLPRPHQSRFPESDGFLSRPAPSVKQLFIPAPPGCTRILTPPLSQLPLPPPPRALTPLPPSLSPPLPTLLPSQPLMLSFLLPCGRTNAGEQVGKEADGAGGRGGGDLGEWRGGCQGGKLSELGTVGLLFGCCLCLPPPPAVSRCMPAFLTMM